MKVAARPRFVAEVSSNHHCDLARCLAFIDVAAELGCYAVKFQLFRVNSLFASEILENSEEHRQRKAWELPLEFLPELSHMARRRDLALACTPFYLEAVEELHPYVDFYKVASYELLWTDLLTRCACTGKPVVLSTGMATIAEIDRAVEAYRKAGGQDLKLLHCISGYPAPLEECNLSAIQSLRSRYGCEVGWSDHSVNADVILRAAHRWNASIIEFHLDIDGRGSEFQSGHCWLPEQIQPVIRSIQTAYDADGDGRKIPTESEFEDRNWRADPADGLRPLKNVRQKWRKRKCPQ